MVKPWKQFRSEITTLYIKEARTLDEVKQIMSDRHGFVASIRSYRQRFDQWNLQKYNCKKRQQRKAEEMERQTNGERVLMYPTPPTSPEEHALGIKVEGGPRYFEPAWFDGPLPQLGGDRMLQPYHPHHHHNQQRQRFLKHRYQPVPERKYQHGVALPAPWYPDHFLSPVEPSGFSPE